jgi:hypothetical protein
VALQLPHFTATLLGKSLLVSLIFHLSAITLFSIVIYFPKERTRYAQLSFVEERPAVLAAAQAPGIVAALTRPRSTPAAAALDLPKLEFDPAGQLELGKLSLSGKSFYEDSPAPELDTWARFGEGIQQVRASLLGIAGAPALRLSGDGDERGGEPATIDMGPGLRALPDWAGAKPRAVLFTPPAFFRGSMPAAPLDFFLSIDATGAVNSVVCMRAASTPIEEELNAFFRQCRFAPQEGGAGLTMLLVRVEPAGVEAAP